MDTVTKQFAFAHSVALMNLDGVTDEQSLVRPDGGGNSINWTLGHIVTARQRLLTVLGKEPLLAEESAKAYARGSAGEGGNETLASLTAAYQKSQELLSAALPALSADDLAKPAPFSPLNANDNVGTLIAKLAVHEGYHVGQLGLLRRIVTGKAGIA